MNCVYPNRHKVKHGSTIQALLRNDYRKNPHLYEFRQASECKTYQLGKSMTWDEFVAMPDDLKYMYVKDIRKKFNTPDEELANAFGVSRRRLNTWFRKLELSARNSDEGYDREGFMSWWNSNGG